MATKSKTKPDPNTCTCRNIFEHRERNAAMKCMAKPDRIEVKTGTSFGLAQPYIEMRTKSGTHHRRLKARLHRLAAEVEEASVALREHWIVRIECGSDYAGAVVLELAGGDRDPAIGATECERGLKVLREVVAATQVCS